MGTVTIEIIKTPADTYSIVAIGPDGIDEYSENNYQGCRDFVDELKQKFRKRGFGVEIISNM